MNTKTNSLEEFKQLLEQNAQTNIFENPNINQLIHHPKVTKTITDICKNTQIAVIKYELKTGEIIRGIILKNNEIIETIGLPQLNLPNIKNIEIIENNKLNENSYAIESLKSINNTHEESLYSTMSLIQIYNHIKELQKSQNKIKRHYTIQFNN